MEEKNLLRQITYLSRLIGEHKDSQQRNTKMCNFNKPRSEMQKPSYKTNSLNFAVPNRSNSAMQYSCKNNNLTYPAVASKCVSVNASKYRKVNNMTIRNITPASKDKVNKDIVSVHNLTNVSVSVIRPTIQNSTSFITSSMHHQTEKINATKILSTSTTSLRNPINIKEPEIMTLQTSNENFQKVSRVHVNPNFLRREDLHPIIETKIKQEPIRPSVVHVNPKLVAQIMSPEKSSTLRSSVNICGNVKEKTEDTFLSPVTDCVKTKGIVMKKIGNHIFCSKRKLVNNNIQTNESIILRSPALKSTTIPIKKLRNSVHRRHSSCSQNSSLISISQTKIVRVSSRLKRQAVHNKSAYASNLPPPSISSTKIKKHSWRAKNISSMRIHKSGPSKLSSSIKMARLVCSKYKLRNLPSLPKIDRRLSKTAKRFKKVKKYSLKYENTKSGLIQARESMALKTKKSSPMTKSSFSNKVWSNSGFCKPTKIVISQRKLLRIGTSKSTRMMKGEHSSALVRIGGVLYKTSRTKLTRSKTTNTTPVLKQRLNTNTIVKKRKPNNGHTVYVRGNKFIMDPLGMTLRRVPDVGNDKGQVQSTKPNPIKRVDIGGVTFVQKSSNLLIRTNVHFTRSLLSQAKQRSIALLTKKMRKNNQPCMIYHRFGKCSRHEKGMCQLVHDSKNVAVCKKFLQGHCTITGCLLSHSVVPEKMPTCKYFLEGCCVRDNCPYLHVKVSAKAGICAKFLQGYCSDGSKCKKRHVSLCPEFDQTGICHKGKYCPYPHRTEAKKYTILKKKLTKKSVDKETNLDLERKRYYQNKSSDLEAVAINHELHLEESKLGSHNISTAIDEKNKKHEKPIKRSNQQMLGDEPRIKRPKLGRLPSFIALDSKIAYCEEKLHEAQ